MLNDSLFISLFVYFRKEKQSEILHSRFYQRLTLKTKKSDIRRCDFKVSLLHKEKNKK